MAKRLLLLAFSISSLCAAAPARADVLAVKLTFSIGENGELGGTNFPTLSAQESGVAVAAGYQAFGVNITPEEAADDVRNYSRSYVAEDVHSTAEHRGIYRSPQGWHICKAKIDWTHAVVADGTAFSARIERNRQDDGLAYVAAVPNASRLDADLYLEFVPSENTLQYECFAPGAIVWKCRGKRCLDKGQISDTYGIYPPARYP